MEHSVDLGGRPILPYFTFHVPLFGFVPSGLGFRSNGTLLISKPWIIVKSLGSSFNDLLKTIKTIFNNIPVSFSLTQGATPVARLGLWTLRPRFSAVWLPLEPTIEFSTWSAVSHPKPRDFRLPEPTIPFLPLVSGFPHHVTSDVTRPIRSQD